VSVHLIVWYLRKALPGIAALAGIEGRTAEAEALMAAIEKECGAGALPVPAARAEHGFLRPATWSAPCCCAPHPRLDRADRGQHADLRFVTWLPTFFVQQGVT